MSYKLTHDEVEVVVQDWLVEWRELVSAKEILTKLPVDALVEHVREYQSIHDSNGESLTDTDPKS